MIRGYGRLTPFAFDEVTVDAVVRRLDPATVGLAALGEVRFFEGPTRFYVHGAAPAPGVGELGADLDRETMSQDELLGFRFVRDGVTSGRITVRYYRVVVFLLAGLLLVSAALEARAQELPRPAVMGRLDEISEDERWREYAKHLKHDRDAKEDVIATLRAYVARLEAAKRETDLRLDLTARAHAECGATVERLGATKGRP